MSSFKLNFGEKGNTEISGFGLGVVYDMSYGFPHASGGSVAYMVVLENIG